MLRSLFWLAASCGTHKGSMVWPGGARPPPNVLVYNFKLKMNMPFVSIKNNPPKLINF